MPLKITAPSRSPETPIVASWNPYRDRLPTADEIETWWSGSEYGIAIVCGTVSGNIWTVDIDDAETGNQFCQMLKQIWPEFDQRICVVDTPRPGRQLICRLPIDPPGNETFAAVQIVDENGNQTFKTLIESRGTGGYVVGVGSPPSVHRTGRPYAHVATTPFITDLKPIPMAQYRQLRKLAEAFNRVCVEHSEFDREPYGGEPRPGDLFNQHADWQQLLSGCDWTLSHTDADGVQFWRRPGKEEGQSAQLGHFQDDGQPRLSVFSTSAKCGPQNGQTVRVLDPFSFLALEKFDSDFSQAAVEVSESLSEQLRQAQQQYWTERSGQASEGWQLDSKFADEIEERPIHWLWPEFLPLGMLTMYSGEQGLSKSFVTVDLVSRTTQGHDWPGGAANTVGPTGAVMLVGEDDRSCVSKPRLRAAGADMPLVDLVGPMLRDGERRTVFSIREHLELLRHRINQFELRGKPPCRLVIIDPLSAFLGSTDGNDWSASRIVTTLLSELAAELNLAVLLVHHFGKNSERDSLHRSMGSTSFTAAARVFFGGFRDPADADRRIMARVKSNISKDRIAIAYKLERRGGPLEQHLAVAWEPKVFEFDESQVRKPNVREEERRELTLLLESIDYPKPTREVYEMASEYGFGEKRVRSVAKQLGIVARCSGYQGQWEFTREDSEKSAESQESALQRVRGTESESVRDCGFELQGDNVDDREDESEL